MNYIRRAGCPHPAAPETSRHRPSPGHPPGRACPAPTARRRASPLPSANARGGVKTPPYGLTPPTSARPYSDYVNYIRRAGCPHPAASLRSHPSTGSHPRRGRRPRRPGNLPSPPIPGNPPGPGMPGPYRAAAGKPPAVHKRPRRRASPLLSANARGGVKTPPYGLTHQRVPTPLPRGGAGTATKKPRQSLFPGLPRFFI